jgi:hypothetical protein
MRFKSAPELIDLDSKGWESDGIIMIAMMLWFQDGAGSMEYLRVIQLDGGYILVALGW